MPSFRQVAAFERSRVKFRHDDAVRRAEDRVRRAEQLSDDDPDRARLEQEAIVALREAVRHTATLKDTQVVPVVPA
jgi:hypothetical protein